MKLDAVQQAAQEQFARRSHRYGHGHILENVEDVRAAIEPLQLAPGSRVLDVATGAGHTGLFLASLGHEVTLTDIAAPMLERAKEAATRRGLKVQTRQHPAEQFPYADASFDLVTSRVAPRHFSSPESFIRETARVLKRDGHFLLIDGSVEDDQSEAARCAQPPEDRKDCVEHRIQPGLGTERQPYRKRRQAAGLTAPSAIDVMFAICAGRIGFLGSFSLRWILFELWQRGIHVVPWVRV